jgi:hypothetical protein
MHPGSAVIQLLHSAATFPMRGGDAELRGKDFAFIGDRNGSRQPAAVLLPPEQPWKWVTKPAVMDIGPMELFYAAPAHERLLWKAPADMAELTEQNVTLPWMLALPPHFIDFCTAAPRTPFQLHQHVADFAIRSGEDDTLHLCRLVLDWCMFGAHQDASPTTSVVALTMQAAPVDDDVLGEWLTHWLTYTIGPASRPTPQGITADTRDVPPLPSTKPQLAPPGPPPNVWAHVAAQLTQGIANIAAAIQPQGGSFLTSHDPAASYEEGRKKYDEYQLAILKGFSHTHLPSEIPRVWPMFQHTKHMDTHRDNILWSMDSWATSQSRHVSIDRGLYLPNLTMRELLSLRFNPGNTIADLSTADSGMSLLIWRARTSDNKVALK